MKQFRVFGNPIAQSKSPSIHQQFAVQTALMMNYESELVELEQFDIAVKKLIANEGKGANVTAPFKEQAFALCDELSERAKLAGAVNTLIFSNGLIYGDTTDGLGLVNDLLRHHVQLKASKILLLGAGGAAKGVVQSLLEQFPQSLTIANRTLSKAEAIAEQYPKADVSAITFEDTEHLVFDIIINATSAGLSGASLPISDQTIKNADTCYDMVYGTESTAFLKQAKLLRVDNIIDGLGMLVGQAAESFYLWNNIRPDVEPVLMSLRAELNQ
ncbi:shikimate dehydrogenase [Cognaticolwellia mytili]|uniref:shikimate dehydrogenase n=1 Tax=Cognaticolwellia mytili TaxID=1888913 RepID=UPI000A172CD5|nr:shikimate dehydrogenase [Cognaticolwellia mytili]